MRRSAADLDQAVPKAGLLCREKFLIEALPLSKRRCVVEFNHALAAGRIRNAQPKNTRRRSVRFVSDQVNVTLDVNKNPVSGTDAVTEITDIWTFERDLTSSNPAWRLIAARTE